MKRMTVMALALLALICTSVNILAPARQCAQMRQRLTRMQSQTAQLLTEIEELRYAIDSAGERETIELLARRELGLVYPGEIVFYYAEGDSASKSIESDIQREDTYESRNRLNR